MTNNSIPIDPEKLVLTDKGIKGRRIYWEKGDMDILELLQLAKEHGLMDLQAQAILSSPILLDWVEQQNRASYDAGWYEGLKDVEQQKKEAREQERDTVLELAVKYDVLCENDKDCPVCRKFRQSLKGKE